MRGSERDADEESPAIFGRLFELAVPDTARCHCPVRSHEAVGRRGSYCGAASQQLITVARDDQPEQRAWASVQFLL